MIKQIGVGGGGPDTSVPLCPLCGAYGGGGHGGWCPNAGKPPEEWEVLPKDYLAPAGRYPIADRATIARAREMVDHPAHYNAHPSGVECIDIIEHMTFNVGAAVKHLWRAGLKGSALEDLRKAAWYLQREIKRLDGAERDSGAT